MKSQSIQTVFENIDPETFRVILEHTPPCDTIAGYRVADLTEVEFDKVMTLSEQAAAMTPFELVAMAVAVEEKALLKCPAGEFMGFLKHLINELEKIEKLLQLLSREPDPDWIRAGIERLNLFGKDNVYYAMSVKPADWEIDGKTPFYLMHKKLLMDKIHGEIKENHDKIIAEKAKNKVWTS